MVIIMIKNKRISNKCNYCNNGKTINENNDRDDHNNDVTSHRIQVHQENLITVNDITLITTCVIIQVIIVIMIPMIKCTLMITATELVTIIAIWYYNDYYELNLITVMITTISS